MDIAYELAKYLADAGYGTLGTDVFVDEIPGDLDGVYVTNLSGNPYPYSAMSKAALDIYVKNTNASTAKTTLSNIKNLVHRMYSTTTANSYIYSILAIGEIENAGRDLEYAKLYKLTISVIYRDLGLIS